MEARAFQERKAGFDALGAAVFGVSRDSAKANGAFAEKQGLTYPLLCDAGGAVHESLGLLVAKTMYGKPVKGVDRTTALIDPDGIVRRVWRAVKVAGHAEEVLGTLTVLAQKAP